MKYHYQTLGCPTRTSEGQTGQVVGALFLQQQPVEVAGCEKIADDPTKKPVAHTHMHTLDQTRPK